MSSRRKKKQPEAGADWMTTYGDLVTLLMAFFVLLFAMSNPDEAKFSNLLEGLETPFSNETTSATSDGILPDFSDVPDPDTENEVTDANDIDDDPDNGQEQISSDKFDVEAVYDDLTDRLSEAGFDQMATVERDERGLIVSIDADDVLFRSGSSSLQSSGEDVIAEVANVLTGFDNPVVVEGHTDNIPIGRSDYTNWHLSTDRAVSVVRLLSERLDIDAERLSAMGFGEHKPRASNDTPEGRAQNRRIAIVILSEQRSEAR